MKEFDEVMQRSNTARVVSLSAFYFDNGERAVKFV